MDNETDGVQRTQDQGTLEAADGIAKLQITARSIIDLSAIKARYEKSTSGPWSVPHFARPDEYWANLPGGLIHGGKSRCDCGYVLCDSYMGAVATVHVAEGANDGDNPPFEEAKANAELIAHARTDIPALVAEVERLQGDVEKIMIAATLDVCNRDTIIREKDAAIAAKDQALRRIMEVDGPGLDLSPAGSCYDIAKAALSTTGEKI